MIRNLDDCEIDNAKRRCTPCLCCLEPCVGSDVERFPCCGAMVHAHCLREWNASTYNLSASCLVCRKDTAFTITRAALRACPSDVKEHLLLVMEFTLGMGWMNQYPCSLPLLRVRWESPSTAHWTRTLVKRDVWEPHTFVSDDKRVVFYDISCHAVGLPWEDIDSVADSDPPVELLRFPLPMECAPHLMRKRDRRRHLMVPLDLPGAARALAASSPGVFQSQYVLVHRKRMWCLFNQDAGDGAPDTIASIVWTRDVPPALPLERQDCVWYAKMTPSRNAVKPRRIPSMNLKFYGPKKDRHEEDSSTRDIKATLQAKELSRLCSSELPTLFSVLGLGELGH